MSDFNPTKYKNDFNKNNYDSLRIVVPKGVKAKLKEYCEKHNISLNKLINNYVITLLEDDESNSDKSE